VLKYLLLIIRPDRQFAYLSGMRLNIFCLKSSTYTRCLFGRHRVAARAK
jgi:hypothetical protein